MVATAAHLTDHVLPRLSVRQWVLALPKRLRYFLQRDANLQGAALRLFLRAVDQCLRAHSPGATPLELHDRLAALLLPPRIHRHRYFGVLAPHSPLRAAAPSSDNYVTHQSRLETSPKFRDHFSTGTAR